MIYDSPHGRPVVLQTLVLAFWFFLPAYVANPAAVLVGGGTPMDFGRSWRDRRLLGDGKTWRGFLGGGLLALVLGVLQWAAALPFPGTPFSYGPFPAFLGLLAALAYGSLVGDALGSFLKRRAGLPKGHRTPVLDQYDFVLGAFLATGLAYPGWLAAHYLRGEALLGLILILVLTPVLHRVVNLIGYRMGRKEVPW